MLFFADESVLIQKNEDTLQKHSYEYQKAAEEVDQRISVTKIKIKASSSSRGTSNTG